jgi:D-alanine---(R)-lactate ligase
MTRPRIGVLFGGASEEHPISLKSAREVARSIDASRYEPVYVGITRAGEWRLCADPDADLATGRPVVLAPDPGVHGLLLLDEGLYETIRLDAVLPVVHGRHGEDGAIQGLLELAGIPYAGCDVPGSVLCMDKSLAYVVARAAGIRTPAFRVVAPGEDAPADGLAFPVFVKPARSGSSFGVTRVDRAEDLPAAVAVARVYDAKVLIEQAVAGSEVGCAVLETASGLVVGEVDEVRLAHGFFRIHQEDAPEQGSDNSTVVVPAAIPEDARARVRETALAIYRALGCRGVARVDMFRTADGEVVLNEVNTLPGLTSYSRYPRMMAAAGLSLTAVLDGMLSFALAGERS